MQVIELTLPGVLLIQPHIVEDERGFFLERYHKDSYKKKNITCEFVQQNHSCSKKNVLRGLHFQSKPGQDKLVSVVNGKVFDVAVDIRPDSKTFKQWVGIVLDSEKHWQLFIPNGFAHGFCVLSDEAHVQYLVSHTYIPKKEKNFIWNDKDVGIKWPIDDPILSKRDKEAKSFKEVF